MFSLLSQCIKDASVLRRLQFSAKFYPQSMPNYWGSIASFSVKNKEERNGLTPDLAQQIVENLEVIDSGVFTSDRDLIMDIVSMKNSGNDDLLGVVLISEKVSCRYCGSRLHIRSDRSMKVTIYDDNVGTLPGTHYTKYCRKRGCSFQQHYGYYSQGDTGDVKYDDDWSKLPYFMSTRETALSMDMLCRFDREILIGQLSYKQRADLYNDIHGYNTIIENER